MSRKIATLDYVKKTFNRGEGGNNCITADEVRDLGLKVEGDGEVGGRFTQTYLGGQLVPEDAIDYREPVDEYYVKTYYQGCDHRKTYCRSVYFEWNLPSGTSIEFIASNYGTPPPGHEMGTESFIMRGSGNHSMGPIGNVSFLSIVKTGPNRSSAAVDINYERYFN